MSDHDINPAVRQRWPKAPEPWLKLVSEWSERTGADPDTPEHMMPCVGQGGCDQLIDCSDLAQVFAHEHRGPVSIEPGKYIGEPK